MNLPTVHRGDIEPNGVYSKTSECHKVLMDYCPGMMVEVMRR